MARTIPTEAETQKNVYKAANAPAASINRIQPNVLAPSTSTEGQLLPTHSVDAAASEEITIDVGANLRAGVTVGFEGVIRHIYPKTTAAGAGIEVGWRLMIVMMGKKLFETEQLTEARVGALLDEAKSSGEPYALTFASQERQEELRTNRLEREKKEQAARFAAREGELRNLIDNHSSDFGVTDARTLAAMRELASLFLEMEMKNEAHELLATVLNVQSHHLGERHESTLESMHALAEIEIRVFDDIEEAERLLQEVLQVQREDTAPTDPRRLEIITNLGCICFSRSQFAEAQALFQEAIDVMPEGEPKRIPSARRQSLLEALRIDRDPFLAAAKASDEKRKKNAVAKKLADGAKKREAEEAAVVAAAWEAIRADGLNLRQSPAQLKEDRAFVLAAVHQSGFALEHAGEVFQNDHEIVVAACKNNGFALYFASNALANDRSVVYTAVNENGYALQYASQEMMFDKEAIRLAEGQCGVHLKFTECKRNVSEPALPEPDVEQAHPSVEMFIADSVASAERMGKY